MNNTIYMECRGVSDGAESNKFYEIVDDGHQVTFRWGSIGADGKSRVALVSEDATARRECIEAQLKAKRKYKIISKTNGDKVIKVENRPSAEGRRFGLEVETHSKLSVDEVAVKMKDRGLAVNNAKSRYFHSTGKTWDVKRDGSCGFEFASPILSGEAGIFDSKLAVEKIRDVCSTAVNQSCGIHVTVDVSDHKPADLARLVIGYIKAQEHFYAQCAEWRQSNRYCMRNPNQNLSQMVGLLSAGKDASTIHPHRALPPRRELHAVEQIVNLAGGYGDHGNRYLGLNMTRMFSLKVIEFRMMESSVDIRKVGRWIRICVGFVDGLLASGVTFTTPELFSEETFNSIVEKRWNPSSSTTL